jgi:OOP family OmpA-OmpF porin
MVLGGRAFTVAGVLLWSSAARAQQEAPLELGLFGGAHAFADDNELGRPERPALGSQLDIGPGFGVRFGVLLIERLHLEVEAMFLFPQSSAHSADVKVLAWRGQLLFDVIEHSPIRPFLLAGYGALTVIDSSNQTPEGIGQDTDPAFHAGAGFKLDLNDWLGLRADGRILLLPAVRSTGATSDWEILTGFYARFAGAPKAAAPPAPVSTRPPAVPPPAGPPSDTDGDGIPDVLDKCPHEPEDKDGFQDADGCPDPDNDGDGVPDAKDRCPEDMGPQENDGCPDEDSDLDGIPDRLDKCPHEAETKNGYQDADGCPDDIPKPEQKFTGIIEGVRFATGKATLKTSSFKVLDKAVGVLFQFREVKLEIQGHTDERGTHELNMELSQQRAEAVKAYFVGKGIDAARLSAVGFGPDKPLGSNTNKQGRAKNRRVEFHLVSDTSTQGPERAH